METPLISDRQRAAFAKVLSDAHQLEGVRITQENFDRLKKLRLLLAESKAAVAKCRSEFSEVQAHVGKSLYEGSLLHVVLQLEPIEDQLREIQNKYVSSISMAQDFYMGYSVEQVVGLSKSDIEVLHLKRLIEIMGSPEKLCAAFEEDKNLVPPGIDPMLNSTALRRRMSRAKPLLDKLAKNEKNS